MCGPHIGIRYLLQTLCCVVRALKVSRKHHTQLKYIRRLENNKDTLETLNIDSLNEKRFDMPRWRIPVLHVERGTSCPQRRNKEEEVEDIEI
jgi:hypothetical protein